MKQLTPFFVTHLIMLIVLYMLKVATWLAVLYDTGWIVLVVLFEHAFMIYGTIKFINKDYKDIHEKYMLTYGSVAIYLTTLVLLFLFQIIV